MTAPTATPTRMGLPLVPRCPAGHTPRSRCPKPPSPCCEGGFRIRQDRSHSRSVLADRDNLPALISSELGERESIGHLQTILVLRGEGSDAQYGEPCCDDHC